MAAEFTFEEIKEFSLRLDQILRNLIGVKSSKGDIVRPGLLDELNELYNKLDPVKIDGQINRFVRNEVVTTLEKIDMLLIKQQEHIEDATMQFEKKIEIVDEKTTQMVMKIEQSVLKIADEEMKKIVIPHYQELDLKLHNQAEKLKAIVTKTIGSLEHTQRTKLTSLFLGNVIFLIIGYLLAKII